ncbi:TerC family protein [Lutibacter citreus]|uniref:TerC family protein n=1 Tax=Lutibacter citreus TaxID=2138210 RepID=UPI000DBE1A7E|nr:TerC family protein [Lutibacter citreus]
MEIFLQANTWIALLTLIFLEIVLGIDNIVFISIVSNKLEEKDRPKARNIGLILAMVFRIGLLFGISWVLQLQNVLIHIDTTWLKAGITGQSLIIIAGGLFLLYKSVAEIHHKLEGDENETNTKASSTILNAIIQIVVLDLVFSFDSILTAIGLVSFDTPPVGFGYFGGMAIIIIAIIVSIIIMLVFAGPVSKFVNEHPTIQILGLSFLLLIGVMLLAEGSHLAHFEFFGNPVHSIPKGYLYFAIFFSLFVEFLNLKLKKGKNPVQLHNSTIVDEKLKNSKILDK